jgi:predicted nucleic acid-binding protein
MRRYYIDTSVFGGCFEGEWIEASMRLLDLVHGGRVKIVTSAIVRAELVGAPERVRRLVESLPATAFEVALITAEVDRLQQAYLAAGVLGKRSEDDAAHVAVASVARVDAIVSWNFRDLVREDRIRGFNRVNLEVGYGLIMIVSPQEVRFDDDQEG